MDAKNLRQALCRESELEASIVSVLSELREAHRREGRLWESSERTPGKHVPLNQLSRVHT